LLGVPAADVDAWLERFHNSFVARIQQEIIRLEGTQTDRVIAAHKELAVQRS
jgi:hypothetical protein